MQTIEKTKGTSSIKINLRKLEPIETPEKPLEKPKDFDLTKEFEALSLEETTKTNTQTPPKPTTKETKIVPSPKKVLEVCIRNFKSNPELPDSKSKSTQKLVPSQPLKPSLEQESAEKQQSPSPAAAVPKPENSKIIEPPKFTKKCEFRNKEDEFFILSTAPKEMTKMLMKRKGWVPYHEDLKTHPRRYMWAGDKLPERVDMDEIEEKYEKLMRDKAFAISFPTEKDQNWLRRCLQRRISDSECFGYVYVYHRSEEIEKKKDNKVMAFKIGRSVDAPKRISHSSRENGENYSTALLVSTNFYKHLEVIIHDYFQEERMTRTEVKDGKTEWFFLKFTDIKRVVDKCKVYLNVVHKDQCM